LKSFWDDVFLKEIKRKFSISHEQLVMELEAAQSSWDGRWLK
jgi:hypothetical protein